MEVAQESQHLDGGVPIEHSFIISESLGRRAQQRGGWGGQALVREDGFQQGGLDAFVEGDPFPPGRRCDEQLVADAAERGHLIIALEHARADQLDRTDALADEREQPGLCFPFDRRRTGRSEGIFRAARPRAGLDAEPVDLVRVGVRDVAAVAVVAVCAGGRVELEARLR